MNKRTSKLFIWIILFTTGFTIALLYGNYRLGKQRVLMQIEIDKSERKSELLQRRYVEQKATSDRLQRMNISLNGQKNTLQTELDREKEEFANLEKEFEKLKNIENEKSGKLSDCINNYSGLMTANKELKRRLEEETTRLSATINEYKEQITDLETDRDNKISEIRSIESRMESCMNKNARLCIIADELINRYEDKGIMSSLLQKEPLTQIKKVELEKFAQEYKENIEKQKERIRDQ